MRNWTAAGLGAIAAIAVVGGAGVIASPPDWARGSGGGMHRGPGHMMGAFCGPQAGERLEHALTSFESFAKFEGQQQTSWIALRDTLKQAQPQVQEICGEVRGIRDGNSVDKLTTVQDALTKAAAVVAELQPAYANFYGTLDDAQKRTLDEMFEIPSRHMRRG
ncbi:MAG TPA: Spy/CpxP family protein refolding chaperone [Geminicoccus sp.]|uniref:Spy/CpxP family protein refolding chaperone n=1 Tax=Geminicoccus sp. TaxID=2024832 RepID=UPI002E33144D|nr:Spy/CpxP family protein refolding chaperone [Geminicoccus sp.]HEX2525055.1 Spy/CpxP family protein refolding chaperone [Geminicoccus sp.]